MDGNLEICNKESLLLEALGKEGVHFIYNQLLKEDSVCHCCGFVPKQNQKLKMHTIMFDDNNPANSKCVLLCEACYYIKHFEKAIELEYVVLVNSEYNQIDLIKIQRNSTIAINKEIDKKRISILKQKPIDYLNIIKEDKFFFSPYIKVVFSDKFKWNNCR